ncbi:hypothetical protein B296_00030428 [Ensete ventricosum]|uniref:Uncharacterized protein n=1 Tax=Ensete ventricosum TaxID=4639 RepID=A0A426YLF7_ENSVE|nr:hypothetical protein B296_00030428 [Ensete ventricosum]
MDIERRQSEIIDDFVKRAAALYDAAPNLAGLILEATAHPFLFAFSEILSVPSLARVRYLLHPLSLKGTQYSSSLDVLRLFAYGTWSDYKRKRN